MNNKIYTTPNIDVVELQGEVVLAAVSSGGVTVNDGSGASDPEINFGNGTLSNGNQEEALSGGYFKVWDDEE